VKRIVLNKKLPALIFLIVLIVVGVTFRYEHTRKEYPLVLPVKSNQDSSQKPTSENIDLLSRHLVIDKLGINVPITINVNGANKEEYFKALQNGVAHMKGSALPGEGSNIFIFGHSSFYSWDPGYYKDVFANLDRLDPGDQVVITGGKVDYRYLVKEKSIVDPKDISVIKPTSSEQLTLMTCWPPGTIKKRLIVIALLDKSR